MFLFYLYYIHVSCTPDREIRRFTPCENSMKIKLRRIKACKKKNLTCVSGMDRQICPSGHSLASLGEPRDAKLRPSGQICLSVPDTHVRFLYSQNDDYGSVRSHC